MTFGALPTGMWPVLFPGSAWLCVEVRVEDANLGDLIDWQRIAQRGLANRFGTGRVVDAERAGFVLAYERADPGDALLGVALDYPAAEVSPGRVGSMRSPSGKVRCTMYRGMPTLLIRWH